jgi:hypothetical protein
MRYPTVPISNSPRCSYSRTATYHAPCRFLR